MWLIIVNQNNQWNWLNQTYNDGIRQMGYPSKMWWYDVKDDMKSLDLAR